MFGESWDWNERVIDLEPLSADFLGRRAFKQWIRGQVPAADKVADQLRALYPTDPWAFYVRFKIYAFTGRAKAALAMLNGDPTLGGRPALARFWRACLEALDQRSPETIAKARQASIDGARTSPQMATEGLQVMGALGEIDTGVRARRRRASSAGSPRPTSPGRIRRRRERGNLARRHAMDVHAPRRPNVLEGIKPGDKIIVSGTQFLIDGAPVLVPQG